MEFYDLSHRRKNYEAGSLDEKHVNPDPFVMFKIWFEEAASAGIHEPNAMALATSGENGRPSVRMVLLKSFDTGGFTFYTNFESRKGRQLAQNPHAAILFFWDILERQIRIEGCVKKVPEDTAVQYFTSRPPESRIAAAISRQSQPVTKDELVSKFEEMVKKHPDGNIQKPANWGGFRLIPELFEFWQGRPGRLHDRIQYQKTSDAEWMIERLSP